MQFDESFKEFAIGDLRCQSYSQSLLDYVVLNILGSVDHSMQFEEMLTNDKIEDLTLMLLVANFAYTK